MAEIWSAIEPPISYYCHPRQNFNPRHARHRHQSFMDPRYPRHHAKI